MGAHEQDERPASEILTIEELALYLKVAKSTLYKLAQEGKLPAQKVGRHWRFQKRAIDRWMEQGRAPEAGGGPHVH
jgi:excisionase family DNA binding protein